jgi:hypothetical protein
MTRLVLVTLALAACARQQPPAVASVAMAGDVVYALRAGRLDAWKTSERAARPLGLGPPVALAGDGSVVVTSRREGRGTRLDVWALDTRKRAFTGLFTDGIERVLGVSRVAVALRVQYPEPAEPEPATIQLPERRSYGALWTLARDSVPLHRSIDECGAAFAVSADGARFACEDGGGLVWVDIPANRRVDVVLAPDWASPDAPGATRLPGTFEFLPYEVLSLRLGADGSDVYVTYYGTQNHAGWRLERWVPSAGSVTRLASADRDWARLLAVSLDGRLLVLGGAGAPLTVRRAPGYQLERLEAGAATATAAALSPDGQRLVTGHADGRLRLWDAPSGRLLATARP